MATEVEGRRKVTGSLKLVDNLLPLRYAPVVGLLRRVPRISNVLDARVEPKAVIVEHHESVVLSELCQCREIGYDCAESISMRQQECFFVFEAIVINKGPNFEGLSTHSDFGVFAGELAHVHTRLL